MRNSLAIERQSRESGEPMVMAAVASARAGKKVRAAIGKLDPANVSALRVVLESAVDGLARGDNG